MLSPRCRSGLPFLNKSFIWQSEAASISLNEDSLPLTAAEKMGLAILPPKTKQEILLSLSSRLARPGGTQFVNFSSTWERSRQHRTRLDCVVFLLPVIFRLQRKPPPLWFRT